MTRLIAILLTVITLGGCSTNLSQDGLIATASSTGAAVVGTAVGGPVVGAIIGTAAGVTSDYLTEIEVTTLDVLEVIPEADRADVLKNQKIWEAIEHIGIWIILSGVFVIFILPLIVGWINSALKGRKYKKEMVIAKENLFDNPNVFMKDFTQERRKG